MALIAASGGAASVRAAKLATATIPIVFTAGGDPVKLAVTFKSAVDDPSRIAKSKVAGALFGLTPKKYQSGEKDVTGGINANRRRDGAHGTL